MSERSHRLFKNHFIPLMALWHWTVWAGISFAHFLWLLSHFALIDPPLLPIPNSIHGLIWKIMENRKTAKATDIRGRAFELLASRGTAHSNINNPVHVAWKIPWLLCVCGHYDVTDRLWMHAALQLTAYLLSCGLCKIVVTDGQNESILSLENKYCSFPQYSTQIVAAT